ncbi:hypothetical protein [Salegentibacter salinarum]|nr:hypothetical protein [Salegentibacter salinarum]
MVVVFAVFTAYGKGTPTPAHEAQQDQTFTILHTNDIHGNYMPFLTTTVSATS